jgi:hypothetical protein
MNPKYHVEYLERYYYSNHPVDILEPYITIIPPSPILDFIYLEVIPENPRLFLVFLIGIKTLRANDLLVEQVYQISIGSS